MRMFGFALLVSHAGAYNPTAAVSWADQNCGVSDGTECAEFVSNALSKAGESCFHTYVPDLDSCLKGHGWTQGSFPGHKGAVVMWYDAQGPYHAALSRGDGTIDQHNPSRCGTSGSWGSNYVLNPPGTEVKAASDSELENLSASQIAALWTGSNCATAVAVALAESSGKCKASHTNAGGTIDRGLWQVNDYWHPECSDSCAYDCSCNAGCAKSIAGGGSDWTPWATYNAGAHLKYMSQAQAACGGQDISV
jgi:hypothetical protein